MKKIKLLLLGALAFLCHLAQAQALNIIIYLDIKCSVKGVSDSGRYRHITLRSALSEIELASGEASF